MTAHIVYRALDPALPATLSRRIIGEIIRGEIGFDGVLISDDLSMQALGGGLGERARAALAAGCDLALHCNGDQREMAEIAGAVAPLSHAASRRIARGEAMRRRAPEAFDRAATTARLDALMAGEAA
jgi:beta-N-acetylhexosaminidase